MSTKRFEAKPKVRFTHKCPSCGGEHKCQWLSALEPIPGGRIVRHYVKCGGKDELAAFTAWPDDPSKGIEIELQEQGVRHGH